MGKKTRENHRNNDENFYEAFGVASLSYIASCYSVQGFNSSRWSSRGTRLSHNNALANPLGHVEDCLLIQLKKNATARDA